MGILHGGATKPNRHTQGMCEGLPHGGVCLLWLARSPREKTALCGAGTPGAPGGGFSLVTHSQWARSTLLVVALSSSAASTVLDPDVQNPTRPLRAFCELATSQLGSWALVQGQRTPNSRLGR